MGIIIKAYNNNIINKHGSDMAPLVHVVRALDTHGDSAAYQMSFQYVSHL